jgi:hypothetical protein
MNKQILTLDSLYQFFVEQNKSVNFNSKECGKPIVVKTNGFFESTNDDMPGMLKLKLKVCHIETNRNGSHISQENMEKAMPTLKYRPILAYIHTLPDGTEDFYAHNVEIIENENGETEFHYIEKQVGCFTAEEPWLEYDKDMDKTYVMAYAVIPEDYTSAADIIRRKNGTKVSCELVINELAYNAKEKYLDLTDFYFNGTTLLGCDEDGNEIGEGMLGARADISDFCHKDPIFIYQNKMIEVLDRLNTTLANFNTNIQKGGNVEMNIFETLLEKYGKTVEDVTFDVEGLSDEELEAKFKEAFEDSDGDNATDDNTGNNGSDDGSDGSSDDADNNDDADDADGDVGEPEKFTKTFTVELSHEDVRYALYNLIRVYEEEDNEWYSIRSVYDNYFYMQGWYNNKLYKIGYTVDGENVALEGDRQEMFEIIVSESEKLAIEKLREDYSALEVQYNELKAFKTDIEAAQLQAQKDVIFAKEEFTGIANTKAFKKLIDNSKDYTIEECEQKAKDILDTCNDFATNFAAEDEGNKRSGFMAFNVNKKESKKGPYGNLFNKD